MPLLLRASLLILLLHGLVNAALPADESSRRGIVFHAIRDGQDQVVVVNADGSNETLLVAGGASPCWSADGRRVAFSTYVDGDKEIHVMRLDGIGRTNLTRNSASDTLPAWSPDGSRIAFHSDRTGQSSIASATFNAASISRNVLPPSVPR